MKISLMEILKEILDFNTVKSYPIRWSGHFAKFKTADDLEIVVEFDEKTNINEFEFLPFLQDKITELVNVSFTVNGEDAKYTNLELNSALALYKTVKDAVERYIAKKKPQCVAIISVHKDGSVKTDPQKDKLYKMIWKKYPVSGYGISDVKFLVGDLSGFCLYKTT
jgi:hypothetical protein